VSVVRDAGLPVLTAEQVHDEAERLLDRAETTGRLPFGLLRRWSAALASPSLWRFETTVVLGGVEPGSFVLTDDADGVPQVTGLLTWGGLSAGDPAIDLRWLATAPDARDDVLAAYTAATHRAPDGLLAERARLHAELEFARWLVHGHATGSESVIDDAVSLLEALDENVRDEPPIDSPPVTADEAFAARERVPETVGEVDTSMQTDAYHPDMGDLFGQDETTGDVETVPIELSEWSPRQSPATGPVPPAPEERSLDESSGDQDELDEAARNALRRWTGTA